MHKTKKKAKTGKVPKPIKVKKEKTEEDRTLHPMSHYIDDRLELVKQIFGSLKPKTITNLAPDFLKNKNMDDIEELCLNELLGISTKRLLSIINATKCPTDTESSSDSDVEHQEEHISLEEISSDSEIEGASGNGGKKKSSGTDGKTGAKKSTKTSTEKDENNGQISVLELLELQARARAIRSQLALEPVTKIEVDSDGEKDKEKNDSQKPANGAASKEHKRKRRRKSNENSKDAVPAQSATISQVRPSPMAKASKGTTSKGATEAPSTSNTKLKLKENASEPTKPNKLKRNYRVNNQESETVIGESEKKSKKNETGAASQPSTTKAVKKEARSRSATPDVIPIIPEPETLLISDSSDGEKDVMSKKKSTHTEYTKKISDASKLVVAKVVNEKPPKERKSTELEEGELVEKPVENDKEKGEGNSEATETHVNISSSCIPADVKKPEKNTANSVDIEATTEEASKPDDKGNAKVENKPPDASTSAITTATTTTSTATLTQAKQSCTARSLEEEDDRNDDVISLEGGDLEEEMIEHLEEDTNTKSSFATSPKKKNPNVSEEQDADVISLDSSEEDDRDKKNSESWHSRYLKSSKVSKVLAASRLGKRVRDSIKQSKRSKKDSERAKAPQEKEKSSTSFASKHEDGSVEQYKELLALRQRKKP